MFLVHDAPCERRCPILVPPRKSEIPYRMSRSHAGDGYIRGKEHSLSLSSCHSWRHLLLVAVSACFGAGVALQLQNLWQAKRHSRSETVPPLDAVAWLSRSTELRNTSGQVGRQPVSGQVGRQLVAQLRYAWMRMPPQAVHMAARSGELRLRRLQELGPIQTVATTRIDQQADGEGRPLPQACGELCRVERPLCLGYAWRGANTSIKEAQCLLIRAVAPEAPLAANCSAHSNTCDGITSEDGRACCPLSCGACGGAGCASRIGGRLACCANRVLASARCCASSGSPQLGSPCVLSLRRGEAADITRGWEHTDNAHTPRRRSSPSPLSPPPLPPPPPPSPPSPLPLPPPPPLPPLPPLLPCPSSDASRSKPAVDGTFVLVTASARVGSNWLRSMLVQHPQVYGGHPVGSLRHPIPLPPIPCAGPHGRRASLPDDLPEERLAPPKLHRRRRRCCVWTRAWPCGFLGQALCGLESGRARYGAHLWL